MCALYEPKYRKYYNIVKENTIQKYKILITIRKFLRDFIDLDNNVGGLKKMVKQNCWGEFFLWREWGEGAHLDWGWRPVLTMVDSLLIGTFWNTEILQWKSSWTIW